MSIILFKTTAESVVVMTGESDTDQARTQGYTQTRGQRYSVPFFLIHAEKKP